MKKNKILDIVIIFLTVLCIVSIINATNASTENDNANTISNSEDNTAVEGNALNLEGELGDVNNDGEINAKDASKILIYVSEKLLNYKAPSQEELNVADTYKDGQIDALDASAILIYSAQKGAGKETSWELVRNEMDSETNEE